MKVKKEHKGFTLIELIFVIAIIVILASIFLPLAINKLNKTDEAVADASAQEIAAALTSFFEDLRHFPACGAGPGGTETDCSPLKGSNNDLVFLAFGDGFGSLTADYPDAAAGGGNWDFNVNDESDPAVNNAANHLVQNDPLANGTVDEAADYATSGKRKWSGPYLARVGLDPFGRTYIAYVGAMEKNGTTISGAGSAKQRGWILSAGPDNSLDTLPSSATLQGDDRGFIFHTN